MKIEKEIEFKTELTKAEYDNFIKLFRLENSIYKLDNYYFETTDNALRKKLETLRIRVKDNKTYTLTLKKKDGKGSLENHLTLNEAEALKMIDEGFSLKELFDLKLTVYPFGKLTTYRVSIPYKEGELFFDKINYYGIIKYEIEYEAKYYSLGYKVFMDFLKTHNIKYTPTMKKSRRVLKYLEEQKKT